MNRLNVSGYIHTKVLRAKLVYISSTELLGDGFKRKVSIKNIRLKIIDLRKLNLN